MARTPTLKIRYRKSALLNTRNLSVAHKRTLRTVLDGVAQGTDYRHNNLKPLKGVNNGFRLRLGDWRVSFVRDTVAGTVDVFEIQPRGKAYR